MVPRLVLFRASSTNAKAGNIVFVINLLLQNIFLKQVKNWGLVICSSVVWCNEWCLTFVTIVSVSTIYGMHTNSRTWSLLQFLSSFLSLQPFWMIATPSWSTVMSFSLMLCKCSLLGLQWLACPSSLTSQYTSQTPVHPLTSRTSVVLLKRPSLIFQHYFLAS